jgi:hypothetical protein
LTAWVTVIMYAYVLELMYSLFILVRVRISCARLAKISMLVVFFFFFFCKELLAYSYSIVVSYGYEYLRGRVSK